MDTAWDVSRRILLTSFKVKMDGAILLKRIIKVDFAHHEKLNPVLKNRRSAKDATQVTTLSMLKGSQHTRYFLFYE